MARTAETRGPPPPVPSALKMMPSCRRGLHLDFFAVAEVDEGSAAARRAAGAQPDPRGRPASARLGAVRDRTPRPHTLSRVQPTAIKVHRRLGLIFETRPRRVRLKRMPPPGGALTTSRRFSVPIAAPIVQRPPDRRGPAPFAFLVVAKRGFSLTPCPSQDAVVSSSPTSRGRRPRACTRGRASTTLLARRCAGAAFRLPYLVAKARVPNLNQAHARPRRAAAWSGSRS